MPLAPAATAIVEPATVEAVSVAEATVSRKSATVTVAGSSRKTATIVSAASVVVRLAIVATVVATAVEPRPIGSAKPRAGTDEDAVHNAVRTVGAVRSA